MLQKVRQYQLISSIHYIRRMLHSMVGMPDYQQYCEYMRQYQPRFEIVDYKTFYRDRVESRYNNKNSPKCC